MAAVRHLGFLKFNFLTIWEVKRPILHQRTKFRKDWSNRCRDRDFCDFLRWRPPPSWIFTNSKFFLRTIHCRGPICVTVPNLIKIGQTFAEIWRFNGFFSKWRSPAILDLLGAYWDHRRRPLDGLHRCAKFGRNRCRSFDNMKLSIFCPFGLKTPIYASKNWGFRGILPQNGEQCQRSPQKAHLRVVTVLAVY